MITHPLLARLLRKVGAPIDEAPSLDAWRALLALVGRTYHEADQDRYTLERSIDISSREMQGLYQEIERKTESQFAALRMSDERHRLMFDRNPMPIWVFDAETFRFLAVNDAMIRIYGYSRDELLAMRLTELKLPSEAPDLLKGVDATIAGHVHHVGIREHVRKDGTVLEMDITSQALEFDGRRAILAIGIDMTRAKKLEEQLRQTQKMEAIGQLAGGVAHDFNNILAAIIAHADLALDDLGTDHPVAADIIEIEKAGRRAAVLTRQLLAFSRKEARHPQPLALNAIVANIETMLSRIVGEDIAMSAVLAPQLGTIEADAGQIEQVLMNLVVNARDAMPNGGRLLIETMNVTVDDLQAPQIGVCPGMYALLAVTDSGCGMTDAVRTRIFEPFFTTKDVDKGTGLGLSTVFGIVKQSNGGVTAYSELGVGTTFRIYLPCVDGVGAAATVGETRFVPSHGSGTVLVVEDDPQVRHVINRYLTSWGYTLLQAHSGPAALELVRDHAGPIDLLLTDLVMPEMDGRSLSRHLLVERPLTRTVYMSGYTEHAALKNAALGPDDHFVQKPFTAQTLSETVQRALGAA